MDDDFQYALYAPDPRRRWELKPYAATAADLEFARRFIDWNDLGHGIQRVDACRAPDDGLLLVELEDLNPYLSLEALPEEDRDAFVGAFTASLSRFARGRSAQSDGDQLGDSGRAGEITEGQCERCARVGRSERGRGRGD